MDHISNGVKNKYTREYCKTKNDSMRTWIEAKDEIYNKMVKRENKQTSI